MQFCVDLYMCARLMYACVRGIIDEHCEITITIRKIRKIHEKRFILVVLKHFDQELKIHREHRVFH